MTIGSTTPARVTFNCDGVSKVFPIPIQAYQALDITVVLTAPVSAGGSELVLTLNSDYSMVTAGTLAPPQWTLTTLAAAAYATGYTLQAFINPVQAQQTSYVQGQAFPSLAVQTNFDRLTQMVQRLQDQVSRTILAPDGDVSPGMQLPAASVRALMYLAFDANGNVLPITALPGTANTAASLGPILNPRTTAEIAAGVMPVNFVYGAYPLDLRRYGADATGVTFSDSAILAAIAVCGVSALNGARIYLPAGKYKFANPWVMTSGITIEGDGCTTGGTFPGTLVTYTGTSSAHFIQMTGLGGCALKRMQITNTGAFTGAMLGARASSNCTVEDVVFNATTFGCYHIELDQALQFTASRCSFYAGAFSVNGQSSAGGSFSNVVRFDNCFWQGQAAPPINYGGQSWTFKGCTFENLSNGKAGCFGNTAITQCDGVTFTGCWFGDASVAGGVWITFVNSNGVVFSGNFFSGDGVTSTVGIALSGCVGVVITGNFFISFLTAINLVTASTLGLVIKGNRFTTVTNPLGGAGTFGDGATSEIGPNFPQIGVAPYVAAGINGYEWSPNGILEQWGEVTITAGSGGAIVFPKQFPNNLFNLVVGVRSGAATNSAAASAATTSGANVNSAGAGTVVIDWRAKGN